MKIGSGRLRGRKLHTPRRLRDAPDERPSQEEPLRRARAGRLEGARVLDLYAGAGSLGLEALSRGAVFAVFVERGRPAAEAIRRNMDELGLSRAGGGLQPTDVFGALDSLLRARRALRRRVRRPSLSLGRRRQAPRPARSGGARCRGRARRHRAPPQARVARALREPLAPAPPEGGREHADDLSARFRGGGRREAGEG